MGKNGAILVITMWIITVLSAIAVSLAYRMRMELKMAGMHLYRRQALLAANAGVIQALSVLNEDTNGYDMLSEKWSNYSADLYGVNLFKDIAVGDGAFSVRYVYEKDIFTGQETFFYGMQDEARKININKAGSDVLESLPGVTPPMALSIRAWRGDTDIGEDDLFKEDAYYAGLDAPYKRKGAPFDNIEELALVRGIGRDTLYGRDLDGDGVIGSNEQGLIKYVTVYGDGLVNVNTADITVLRAVGLTEDIAYKILRYRTGPDEVLGTADDGIFTDANSAADRLNSFEPLTPDELTLVRNKQALLGVSSRYYTARIEAGVSSKAEVCVTAVLDKESAEGEQIVKWEE